MIKLLLQGHRNNDLLASSNPSRFYCLMKTCVMCIGMTAVAQRTAGTIHFRTNAKLMINGHA